MFNFNLNYVHALSVVCIAVILNLILFYSQNFKSSNRLIIGVLSARQNFAQRDLIRKTWFNEANETSTRIMFIVGDIGCHISPANRRDVYSCHLWNVSERSLQPILSHSVRNLNGKCGKLPEKISFQVVRMAIRIQSIGVLESMLEDEMLVVLREELTQEVFINVSITKSSENKIANGFVYVPVEEHIFPTGFKGSIDVKTDLKTICEDILWDTGDDLITFNNPIFQNDLNEKSAISFQFIVHDDKWLQKHLDSTGDHQMHWNNKLLADDTLIQEEQRIHNDIMLVDAVDVYRNLPSKLLDFLNKINRQFKFGYFLKTDDDCFLNIKKIEQSLETFKRGKLWWGRFRRNWVVNRNGKWEDNDYTSDTYPWFACGSAYVLSKNLTKWLAVNSHSLHQYQGEDVSMGIWLSVLKPNYVDDENWSCDAECDHDSLVRAQLTDQEMLNSFKYLKKCGSICSCPN